MQHGTKLAKSSFKQLKKKIFVLKDKLQVQNLIMAYLEK